MPSRWPLALWGGRAHRHTESGSAAWRCRACRSCVAWWAAVWSVSGAREGRQWPEVWELDMPGGGVCPSLVWRCVVGTRWTSARRSGVCLPRRTRLEHTSCDSAPALPTLALECLRARVCAVRAVSRAAVAMLPSMLPPRPAPPCGRAPACPLPCGEPACNARPPRHPTAPSRDEAKIGVIAVVSDTDCV